MLSTMICGDCLTAPRAGGPTPWDCPTCLLGRGYSAEQAFLKTNSLISAYWYSSHSCDRLHWPGRNPGPLNRYNILLIFFLTPFSFQHVPRLSCLPPERTEGRAMLRQNEKKWKGGIQSSHIPLSQKPRKSHTLHVEQNEFKNTRRNMQKVRWKKNATMESWHFLWHSTPERTYSEQGMLLWQCSVKPELYGLNHMGHIFRLKNECFTFGAKFCCENWLSACAQEPWVPSDIHGAEETICNKYHSERSMLRKDYVVLPQTSAIFIKCNVTILAVHKFQKWFVSSRESCKSWSNGTNSESAKLL